MKRKYQILLLLIVVVIIISGVSYAYFTTMVNNDLNTASTVTSGTMSIEFIDGEGVSLDNALPGDTVTKTFKVKNTGNVDTSYNIIFSDLVNTFVGETDLVYTLTSDTGANVSESSMPTEDDYMVINQSITPYETQEYLLTITFKETNINQDNNQEKSFNGKIKISTEVVNVPSNESKLFAYTGSYQSYTIETTGKYKIETWGAKGGNSGFAGGKGAYTSGYIKLYSGDVIYVYVGGAGTKSPGWNGGGVSYQEYVSGAGGGATDIRVFSTTPTTSELNYNSSLGLASRIMVAGGGGGAATNSYGIGGAAGTLTGYAGLRDTRLSASYKAAQGGSQTIGGTKSDCGPDFCGNNVSGGFGYGGSASTTRGYQGGGGGSGYYGGGGGASGYSFSGAGGSSYISGYLGCVAITSSTDKTPKTGCTDGTTDVSCSYHYSGYRFSKSEMIDGNSSMPTYDGTSTMIGNNSNGYAKVTFVSNMPI